VVIAGAGPIGLATLVWAKRWGATVVVSEVDAGRLVLARTLGADAAVDPTRNHPADTLRMMTGHSPDLVFDCIGAKGSLGQAIAAVGPRGRVIAIGQLDVLW